MQIPLEQQALGDMYLMREVVNGSGGQWRAEEGKCDDGHLGPPWASLWAGPDHIYFGHDHQRGLQACATPSLSLPLPALAFLFQKSCAAERGSKDCFASLPTEHLSTTSACLKAKPMLVCEHGRLENKQLGMVLLIAAFRFASLC